MEHRYSVQGQSDKHIDFGTHEATHISAPTSHYGIIRLLKSFNSQQVHIPVSHTIFFVP